jgi:hypothetical protein
MMLLAYWIQRADFTATDHDPVDAGGAVRAFDVHPWQEEWNLQATLESEGSDYCPPGMGLVHPDGQILHVCPTVDGRALVHYHCAPTFRGIAALEAVTHTREGMLRAEAIELIHDFFHGQHDWILMKLRTA